MQIAGGHFHGMSLCDRLSDSEGGNAKVKGTQKIGRVGKFPLILFSCLCFLNSADLTISEPGTGYDTLCMRI